MRKLGILLLVLIVVGLSALPAVAFSPRDSYLDSVAAIAWLEGKTLNVALGNTSNTRTTVNISTTNIDSWGRTIFGSRQVTVPGRTIVLEMFVPANLGRVDQLTVKISEGYRSITVPVQTTELISPEAYIVPADTDLEVTVDLAFLLEDFRATRLAVDGFYQTDGYGRGAIRVVALEGGFRQLRSTNTIEFGRPYMVLGMVTPQVSGLTTLTFNFLRTEEGYGRRDEDIPGPIIMVYGRNMRFSGTSDSGESGRVKY